MAFPKWLFHLCKVKKRNGISFMTILWIWLGPQNIFILFIGLLGQNSKATELARSAAQPMSPWDRRFSLLLGGKTSICTLRYGVASTFTCNALYQNCSKRLSWFLYFTEKIRFGNPRKSSSRRFTWNLNTFLLWKQIRLSSAAVVMVDFWIIY